MQLRIVPVGSHLPYVGVGALDDPTAKRQLGWACRKMLRIFRRDVEGAVPYKLYP